MTRKGPTAIHVELNCCRFSRKIAFAIKSLGAICAQASCPQRLARQNSMDREFDRIVSESFSGHI